MKMTNQMISMKVTNMKALIWFITMMMLTKILPKKIAIPIILTSMMVIVEAVGVNSILVTVSKPFVNHAMNIFTIVTVLNHFVEAVKIQLAMAF